MDCDDPDHIIPDLDGGDLIHPETSDLFQSLGLIYKQIFRHGGHLLTITMCPALVV